MKKRFPKIMLAIFMLFLILGLVFGELKVINIKGIMLCFSCMGMG